MKPVRQIHLAGPDDWYPDAEAHRARRRALVQAAGFVLLEPEPLTETEASEVMAREMYADRLARLRKADAAIVNLTPWRGAGADPGAAFEAGVLAGLGKPVFAYMNLEAEEHAEYAGRVEAWVGLEATPEGLRDPDGCLVEDLGLPETVMLWAEARRLFLVIADPLTDLTGLQLCLDAMKLYAE
ncbi:MAG: nucleoside 2-deoxyribosyltransferase [Caulobacterales bacterium 68-7]|nr:MAG: nucleoside 2-deoxyribosyltransferase [Caulobacterales bacterium 68-7]